MDLDIINMKSNKCVILIPIYKEFINFDEYRSIQNTINLYNDKYDNNIMVTIVIRKIKKKHPDGVFSWI